MILVPLIHLETQRLEEEKTKTRVQRALVLARAEREFDRKHPQYVPRSGEYHHQKRLEEGSLELKS